MLFFFLMAAQTDPPVTLSFSFAFFQMWRFTLERWLMRKEVAAIIKVEEAALCNLLAV